MNNLRTDSYSNGAVEIKIEYGYKTAFASSLEECKAVGTITINQLFSTTDLFGNLAVIKKTVYDVSFEDDMHYISGKSAWIDENGKFSGKTLMDRLIALAPAFAELGITVAEITNELVRYLNPAFIKAKIR